MISPNDKFEMLYCDNASCRVNTFERGDGSDRVNGVSGLCPGCAEEGMALPYGSNP